MILSCIMALIVTGLGYTYNEGGDDWTGLCATGKKQAPIDLNDVVITEVTDEDDVVKTNIKLSEFEGKFITTSLESGKAFVYAGNDNFGTVTINSDIFYVANIHFHSPSENTVNGDFYDDYFCFKLFHN